MKISKKILGVALALIMIFNVFAVGTFAAFPDDCVVKLIMTADKETYAPGDIITLTYSEQVIADIDLMMIGGQYDMGYNSSVFELISTDVESPASHGFSAIAAGYDAGISGVQIPSSAGVSDIYGWDTAVTWNIGDDGTTFSASAAPVDLFTVQIKVKDDAPDGTYTLGYNPAGYEGYNAYSNDGIGLGGLYGASGTDYGFSQANMYEYGTCEITVSSFSGYTVSFDANGGTGTMADVVDEDGSYVLPECGFTAPDNYEFSAWDVNGTEYAPGTTITLTADTTVKAVWARQIIVSHVGEQAKWKGGNANNTAENYLFGFLGQVTGLEVTTEAQDGHDVVTNIQNIVATAVYNGTTVTSEVITMWAVDGGYQFRAVFAGFDPADTKDVSVTFAITMSDGTTTYATADASVDTPNAIYTAAVGRGMPALAA